jgi:hypothetical protein
MGDTIHVRVSGPQFRTNNQWYEQGETLEVPEEIFEKYPRRLERVEPEDDTEAESEEASDDAAPDESEADAAPEADPHPADLSVSELEERLEDVDDVALLEAILEAEQEDPRKTAVEAIEARIDAVED